MQELADQRTLETLDFAGVRDRVVAAAYTERGRRYAGELCPVVDFERVRRDQAATAHIRDLVAGADMHVMPAIETEDLTQRASIGTTLAASELRAVGDALAASAAAYTKTREHARPGDRGIDRAVPLAQRRAAHAHGCDRRTRRRSGAGIACAWAHSPESCERSV